MLASGGTQSFAAALTAAVLPVTEGAANSGEALPEGLVRQKAAGDGKDLPESFGETADDGDEKDETPDAPFAWFAIAPVAPEPAPIVLKLRLPATAVELPGVEAMPQIALPELASAVVPAAAEPATPLPAATGAEPAFELPAPAVANAPRIAAPAREAAPQRIDLTPIREAIAGIQPTIAPRIELPPAREPATGVQPIALAAVQPRVEAQPLAAAVLQPLAAAAEITPAPFRRQLRDAITATMAAATQTETTHPTAVTAMADAQQPALDMRRQEWMGAMVEHIEALRDASPSRETNIRLTPDALGSVDISIRHEGDRVHVRFTAENTTARALLAEAQPRLTELAEARGLRLGQTSIDGGAAGQGNQRHDAQNHGAPRPAFVSAPASALAAETATAEDRIA